MKLVGGVILATILLLGPTQLPGQATDPIRRDTSDGTWALSPDLEHQNRQPRSPSLLDRPARLRIEGALIHDALTRLSAKAGVPLVYSPSLLERRRVTCDCEGATVRQVLDVLLAGSDFRYVEEDGQILIEPDPNSQLVEFGSTDPLAPAVPTPPAPQIPQVGLLAGRVIDAQTLQPVADAQIHVRQTGVGGLSRADGEFEFPILPAGTHTITVHRMGYREVTRQVRIEAGGKTDLILEVPKEAIELDAVVVTGTAGRTQRRAVGNVVSRLDMAEVVRTSPAARIDQALGNRIAGVRMVGQPSTAGGSSQIRIRGTSSLGIPGDPLIYVDGIRLETGDAFRSSGGATSRLIDIDPATVESIEIIKGPAAATLYGTEAANGVIQITTRSGTTGAPSIEANVELGALWLPDPAGKIGDHYWRDRDGNVQSHNLYLLEQQPDRFGKPLFQKGPIQKYNLSVNGGSDQVRYYAGFSRGDTEGITRWDWDVRNRASLSFNFIPADNLSFNITAARTVGETRAADHYLCRVDCYARPEMVNIRPQRGFQARPWEAWIEASSDIRTSSRTTWSIEANQQPTRWFTHRLVGGIDDANIERDQFTPRGARGHEEVSGTAGRDGRKILTLLATPTRTLDYAGSVNLPLSRSVESVTSFGLQYYNRERATLTLRGNKFPAAGLTTIDAAGERTADESRVENTTVGTYVQNIFDFRSRAYLTLGLRLDDNSAFGEDFTAAVYPKASGTWVVSEEAFWRDGFLGLDQLRLRSAWGVAGMQPDVFASETLYRPATGPGETPVVIFGSLGNPELGPEKSAEIEYGFDASFFDGRFGAEFTGYRRETADALVPTSIRPSLGFGGVRWANVGRTRNWGTETQLTAHLLTRDPVRWNMNVAFTTMGNRIEELPIRRILVRRAGVGDETHIMWHVEGFPIGGIHAKRVLSADFVSGNSGAVTNVMCDGGRPHGSGYLPGGSPVSCTSAPDVFLGHGEPKWLVNVGSSLVIFRNLQVHASIDAMGGHHLTHPYASAKNFRSSRAYVMQDDPLFMGQALYSPHQATTVPAAFMKLRELVVLYSLPRSLTSKIGVTAASVSATTHNVATLWQQATHTPAGLRLWDAELHNPAQDIPGEMNTGGPPLTQASLRFNVTF